MSLEQPLVQARGGDLYSLGVLPGERSIGWAVKRLGGECRDGGPPTGPLRGLPPAPVRGLLHLLQNSRLPKFRLSHLMKNKNTTGLKKEMHHEAM